MSLLHTRQIKWALTLLAALTLAAKIAIAAAALDAPNVVPIGYRA